MREPNKPKVAGTDRAADSVRSVRGPDPQDYIDFTSSPAQRARDYQRFGDDKRYEGFFAALAQAYVGLRGRSGFWAEFDREFLLYGRQPSPLSHAARLSSKIGGAQIYFKREDLASPRGPLWIAVVASALLARQLGKRELVTGVARGKCALYTAAIAARLGMGSVIFVHEDYVRTRSVDLARMKLMGAQILVIDAKSPRARDLRAAALEHVLRRERDAFLVMGLEAAPQPYGLMLNDFSGVVGREAVRQLAAQAQRRPQILVARGTSSADALGFLSAFLPEPSIRLVGVQVRDELALPDDTANAPDPYRQMRDENKQKLARGMLGQRDYPNVTREHARLKASGRIEYVDVGDLAAKEAIGLCARLEGYVPPVETAQVIAWVMRAAAAMPAEQSIVALIAEDAELGMWDVIRALGES